MLVGPLGIPGPFLVIAAATVAGHAVRRAQLAPTADAAARTTAASQRLAFDLLRIRPFAGAVLLGCAVWVMIGSFDALWSIALDDLDTAEWIANLGITLFALPLIVFGAVGGRLAQRVGPFRVGTIGLLLGAGFMIAYGLVPIGRGDVRRRHGPLRQRRAHGVEHRRRRRDGRAAATGRPAPRACSAGRRR